MQISWHGLGCFTLVAKPVQGEVTLVTNPYKMCDGNKLKGGVASLVLASHSGKDTEGSSFFTPEHEEEGRKVFSIVHAGEYEIQGIFVTGVDAPKKDGTLHTVYRIDAEGVRVGFLGALDRALNAQEIDALGTIDVLIVPVGGQNVLTSEEAAAVVAQIEPRLVIPAYVGTDGYAHADVFTRVLGVPSETLAKAKITRAQLPEEDMRLVLLER